MILKKVCPYCSGSGVLVVQTSSFLGLIKKEVPTSCNYCEGSGQVFEMPSCKFCDGQGLVGNEREICRACNGTGHADSFSFIPRDKLRPGTIFDRRCDQCGARSFEIQTAVEVHKLTKTWEREEELRQVELIERVKVRCVSCNHTYYIPIDKNSHQDMTDETLKTLEDYGMNLSFMYKQ
jgi:DnaJ-class molecular chaperone